MSILNEDMLMHVNGNLVSPPNDEYPKWSVRTPGIPKSKKGRTVEFDGESPLWKEYKQACIEAVQEHIRNEKLDAVDDMNQYNGLTKEEFDKKLKEDLDNTGF